MIAMVALAQFFWAGGLLTRPLIVVLPSVVRESELSPSSPILDVAVTFVVPTVGDVMTTVQLDVVPPAA